jgi:hypothetical protein
MSSGIKKHVNFSERKENIITKVPLLACQFILEGKTIKEHSGPSINLIITAHLNSAEMNCRGACKRFALVMKRCVRISTPDSIRGT